jgi:hypothetical protein
LRIYYKEGFLLYNINKLLRIFSLCFKESLDKNFIFPFILWNKYYLCQYYSN